LKAHFPFAALTPSVTRTDPRLGTFDIHLNVQSRDEPNPDLFTIPAGYTIQDTRPAQTVN
jgi:hypothetical protein